jgi:hypothetical protein
VRAAWPLCRATWVVVRPRRARDGAVYARSRPVPPRADGTPPGTRYKVYTTYTSLTYLTTHVRRLYSILRVAASEQTERRAHRSPYPRRVPRRAKSTALRGSRERDGTDWRRGQGDSPDSATGHSGLALGVGLAGVGPRLSSTCRVGMGIFYVPGMRVCMCSRHAMCVSSTHPLSIN